MAIPPGITEQDFANALQEFANIVGEEWVFTSEEDTSLYKDVYSIYRNSDLEPEVSAAIAPDSAEQVQAIVRVANRYLVPLYPISTGKNLGYGGSSPILSGSVVLDLKRMNRILNVDTRNHTMLVEPGVSFYDVINYFEENNLPLTMDIPDPAWGSPIGHALERGFAHTYSEHGRDRWDTVCGMEVVLGNGEIVRTGPGACEGSQTWQDQKWGIGPYVDGIFSQSNFGVITKMGFWIRPAHEGYRSLVVFVPRYEDLTRMVDLDSYLQNAGIVNGMTVMGAPMFGGGFMFFDVPPPSPEHRQLLQVVDNRRPDIAPLQQYCTENRIGAWALELKWHLPNRISAAAAEYTKDLFTREIPGCWFGDEHVLEFPLGEDVIATLNERPGNPERVNLGIPSLSRFGMGVRATGQPSTSQGHFWFAPMVPKKGEELLKYQEVMQQAHVELGVPFMGSFYGNLPMYWTKRVGVGLANWAVSTDPEVNRRTREQYIAMTQICVDNGWTEYRAPAPVHTEIMSIINNWNDGSLLTLHEALKDAVDPNGILSAGRYGIWPRHMREEMRGA